MAQTQVTPEICTLLHPTYNLDTCIETTSHCIPLQTIGSCHPIAYQSSFSGAGMLPVTTTEVDAQPRPFTVFKSICRNIGWSASTIGQQCSYHISLLGNKISECQRNILH